MRIVHKIDVAFLNSYMRIREEIERAKSAIKKMEQQRIKDLSFVQVASDYLTEILSEIPKRDAEKVKTLVLLYAFAPMTLARKGGRSDAKTTAAIKKIKSVLGVKTQNLTNRKLSLLTYYRQYNQFRELVDSSLSGVYLMYSVYSANESTQS